VAPMGTSGSGLTCERAARSGAAQAPLEMTEEKNKLQAAHKGSNNLRPECLRGLPGRNANLSIYLSNPPVETLTQPTPNGRLKRSWTSDLHD
jgi:hypothetical protein